MTIKAACDPSEWHQLLAPLLGGIRDIFPIEILGFPAAYSQFEKSYVTIDNGHVRAEGALSADVEDIRLAITLSLQWFEAQRATGDDVLVWRKLPVITEAQTISGPRVLLSMRAHTMTRADLIKHLTEGAA